MYETLFTKIKTTLGKVARVQKTFNWPDGDIKESPAVFFRPAGFTNDFETGSENYKTYRFTVVVLISANNTTKENVFDNAMPKAVDDIVAQFDEDWNFGTVDGHRVWTKIDSADEWQMSDEESGLVAYAPLNLEIKMLTTN